MRFSKIYLLIFTIVIALYSAVFAIPSSAFVPASSDDDCTETTPKSAHHHLALETSDALFESSIANTSPPDTGLRSPIPQPPANNPLDEENYYTPFHLRTPPSLNTNIEYDPESNSYIFQNMIGNTPYGPSSALGINDFIDYEIRTQIDEYWRSKGVRSSGGPNQRGGGGLIPQIKIGGDLFETIFGSNVIDIRPSGNVELMLGLVHNVNKNPTYSQRMQRTTDFKFDATIQLNLSARIGDKINFNLNYNTESNFEFDNKMNLKFEGKEDDLLQLLEFGDVSLPLNSTLITGSQTLFGFKTAWKFGKLTVTGLASMQRSESKNLTITNGAQTSEFYFRADEYEENRHFFIGQYFRENYDQYLSTLPLVSSPIVITKIEVWRTTIGAATEDNRNIVAFTDLGENNPQFNGFQPYQGGPPDNNSNTLPLVIDSTLIRNVSNVTANLRTIGLSAGIDYEKVENARLLNPDEYSFNPKLGFISLKSSLTSDQVLAVAYQYQIIGDDKIYQVGEFSNEVSAPYAMRVKLIKSTNFSTKSPLWDLMMKNVYNLQAYQVSAEKFRLNVLYTGDEEGIPNGYYTTGNKKGIPLIRILGLDRLNQQLDPYPDGVFDFIDNAATIGGTMNTQDGRIYFPTIEPFGASLREQLDEESAEKYCFDSLYTLPKSLAQQYTSKNKYFIEGSYRSTAGAEYFLGAWNVTEGSVRVSAGGLQLTENVHYTVNYAMGTVTITDEGILRSGTPIDISVESNDAAGAAMRKRMFGLNLDYRFNQDFFIGATILNLNEIPDTKKVNYGSEPINNSVWGMNAGYKTEMPWVTKIVDLLPFHSTTSQSNLQADVEFAQFIPGQSRAIGKGGVTYIDDFEAARSTVDLRSFHNWTIASTPQGQNNIFREAMPVSVSASNRRQLAYGFNRALLAWYSIDQLFYNNNSATPNHLTVADQSKPYARAVYEQELFPEKQYGSTAVSTYMQVFNMAYYPTEKGPFNYDIDGAEGFSSGIEADGSLRNPASRWGGIMRRFDNTDFESANYEYIEFWMMDPFIENPTHTGGKLYFNLGDISEDILRDGRKFFENGLPADGSDQDVEYTAWGRVPTIQQIINAFENDDASRLNQDVGFDGLTTAKEREHYGDTYLGRIEAIYGSESAAYQDAYRDPSSDNFHYFRGSDYDELELGIVERYKYYNNSDGNSPTENQSSENYLTTGSSMPNVEDVNNDNTLSEDEKYYQYEIELRPDKMVVGQNYINDVMEAVPQQLPDGTAPTTKWYQFRIPIKNPDKVIGDIQGFTSIRFMRVFMRDFNEPVICRLATFDLVRNNWRTTTEDLLEDGDYYPGAGTDETQFHVGTINLEEHGNREPVPYVLPTGIERENIFGAFATYQQNEQALSMKVVKLADGDARAIYKNTTFDMRRFKQLAMFVHAEAVDLDENLKDGDLTAFMRIGLDMTDNYYEYEIPLQLTPWGVGKDTAVIWPSENYMNFALQDLVDAKQERNIAVRNGSHPSTNIPYSVLLDNGHKITIWGNPNIADVAAILVGVRNPKKQSLNDGDDMQPKSVEVWINELRLSDFDNKTGIAALGRVRLNLADVGDISLSSTYQSSSYGTLEQSITQSNLTSLYTFDFATNIDGGKILFPKKWNVKIPIHYDISMNGEIPEYNPLNPDVKLKDDLKTYDSQDQRDSIKAMTNVLVQRQNVNLTNVRKERNLDKPLKMRPWDVENLDFSYSYSEVKRRDVDIELDNDYIHEGQLGYTFSHNPKNWRPFSKSAKLKSKWLQLIKDFNITPLPKSFTFRTTLTRNMNQFKMRPKSQGNIIIDTNYVKDFVWLRNYSLQWDIAKTLKLDYRADANARLDEPQGLIDTRTEKDSIWQSFGRGGRMNTFNQRIDLSWQVPINKIPLFNWISANVRYSGTYNHTSSPLSLSYLGSTIANSGQISATGTVNLVTLYNNIPYLKKVNQGVKLQKQESNKRGMTNKAEDLKSKKDDPRKSKKDKKEDEGDEDGVNENDSLKPRYGKLILDGTLRVLMMIRNVSLSYTDARGTTLPGYMGAPNLFGIDFTNSSPGFLFVFGGQPNIQQMATDGNWITSDTLLNTPFQQKFNQTINFRSTIEPFKDFRIDVTARRIYSENFTEYFRANSQGELQHFSPMMTGNFNITFCGLGTLFRDPDELFQEFRAARAEIARRIAAENPNSVGIDSTGFPTGYNAIQKEVLTAAFLAVYGDKNIDKFDLTSPFINFPLPNWRLNYNGFTKIKGVDKIFQSLSLIHSYTSTYNVGSFSSNLLYEETNGAASAIDPQGNYIPQLDFTQVAINEQFGPLIGFDMTLKNSMTIKVEYKKTRNIAMSFSNNQITEMNSNEITIGAGYRFKDLKIGMVFSGNKRQVVSDLNLTLAVGIKDNKTTLRKIDENVNQVSSGAFNVTIDFNADYQVSNMVGLRLYYKQAINRPYISTVYDTGNAEGGVSVRLMLTQ